MYWRKMFVGHVNVILHCSPVTEQQTSLTIPSSSYTWWRNGYSVGLAVNRSWVQILLAANCSHLHASVTKQYNLVWQRGGDALRLGR